VAELTALTATRRNLSTERTGVEVAHPLRALCPSRCRSGWWPFV